MRSPAILAWTTLALLPLVPGVAAADASPQYDETLVLTDTPDDYAENGALDIIAMFAKERYEPSLAADVIDVRIQLRAPQETQSLANGTTFRYTLGYTLDGTAHTLAAEGTQKCAPKADLDNGVQYACDPLKLPRPHFIRDDGVHLVLPETDLPVGTSLAALWSATATVHQGNTVTHDAAPGEGNSTPRGLEFTPPSSTASYTTRGAFPYLTLVAVSDDDLFVQPGGETVVDLSFRVHEGVTGLDSILIGADLPEDWTVTGNLGPAIQVSPNARDYECRLTIGAPVTAEDSTVPLVIDALLQGVAGRQRVPLQITVVDSPRVLDQDYVFNLQTPGPFQEDATSRLVTSIVRDGLPLVRYKVEYDLYLDGRLVATIPTQYQEDAPGHYAADYAFPEGGEWQIQAYVAELRPAPAAVFPVTVSEGSPSALPGPGALLMLPLLGVACRLANRRHDNP